MRQEAASGAEAAEAVAVLLAVPGVRRGSGNRTLKLAGRTASPFSKQGRGAPENGLNPHRFNVLHVSLVSTLRLGATAAWASRPELGGGTRSETRNRNAPTGAEANAWTTRAWLLTGRECPHSYGKANSF